MQFDKLKPVDQLAAVDYAISVLKDRERKARELMDDELTEQFLSDGTASKVGRYGRLSAYETEPKDPETVAVVEDQDAFMAWVEDHGGEVPDGIDIQTTLAKPGKIRTRLTRTAKQKEAIKRDIAQLGSEAVRGLLEGGKD